MKILTKDIDNFLNKIPEETKSILIYGPDEGQVKQRAEKICASRDLVARYKYEEIKSNPYQLIDSLGAINLFKKNLDKERIAIVEFSGSSIAEPLLSIVKKGDFKGKLLFLCNELGTDSLLRRTFENNSNTASLACYADDMKTLANFVDQVLSIKKVSIEPAAKMLLVNAMNLGNRDFVSNEIEKIILFLGNKNNIKLSDIENYFDSLGAVSFERLCYDLSLRKIQNIQEQIEKLQQEGHNLVSIIRMVAYHFNRLYQARVIFEETKNITKSIETLIPQVFFKNLNDFTASVKLWNSLQLREFIFKLNQLELSAKKHPNTINLIVNYTFSTLLNKIIKH